MKLNWGRPGHFVLHATVAVLSYLVFCLMPPIIYGFSFRKCDDKDLKLAALSAAFPLCASYFFQPGGHTFQTIFYYVSVGVSVSGIGYVPGHFVNMLLEKLHVFDTCSSIEPATVKGAWSSFLISLLQYLEFVYEWLVCVEVLIGWGEMLGFCAFGLWSF